MNSKISIRVNKPTKKVTIREITIDNPSMYRVVDENTWNNEEGGIEFYGRGKYFDEYVKALSYYNKFITNVEASKYNHNIKSYDGNGKFCTKYTYDDDEGGNIHARHSVYIEKADRQEDKLWDVTWQEKIC